jgi:hypothetical protein
MGFRGLIFGVDSAADAGLAEEVPSVESMEEDIRNAAMILG